MNEPTPSPQNQRSRPSLRVLLLRWRRRLVSPLTLERRAEVQVQLRQASTPDFDYFLLVVLSSVIATSGLITDSAAVIIGAMLVAPLMSPILGLSLASLTGDARLARDAVSGLLRGMSLAVGVSFLLTWVAQILPFNPIASPLDLPQEVVARARPSPFDLGVAVAGGLAAAFALAQPQLSAALPGVAIATALMPPLCAVGIGVALGNWRIAGGAFLLFLTNLAAIAFAGVLTFFGLGFRLQGEVMSVRRIPRSLKVSAALVGLLVIPLGYVSASILTQGREAIKIRELVRAVVEVRGAELVSAEPRFEHGQLHLEITVRSERTFFYPDVVSLRDQLASELQDARVPFSSLSVALTVIPSTRLDPAVPPTFTPTYTPGPTPTPSATPTPTASRTPTVAPTDTPPPTDTPTATATPSTLVVANTDGLGLKLRASPYGAVIGRLTEGTQLLMLYGYQIERGLVWVEVVDPEGRRGWVPLYYTAVITLTPTPTHTMTFTPGASP